MKARKCPIEGCTARISGINIMCRDHWGVVSPETQRRVWRLYRGNRGSAEHLGAINDAITEAEAAR